VVLSPRLLSGASLGSFLQGRIPGSIVIEMGLDYDFHHLSADCNKLVNSRVEYGYLIHLVREGQRDHRAEDMILRPPERIRTAYAHVVGGKAFFKLTSDTQIQTRTF